MGRCMAVSWLSKGVNVINLTAGDVQRILRDETFQEIIRRVRQQQIDIFVNSHRAEIEALKDAKYMLEAINRIEQALQSVVSDEAIKKKRENLK